MTVQIHAAHLADVPAILAIYNDAVLHTTASWDYEPHTLEQRTHWFQNHQQQGLPIFVARTLGDDAVVGWGALSKFRERIGYQYTVEHSVYVAPESRGQGIGRAMVLALIAEARQMGKHVIIGGIEQSNEASLRLHYALGFEQVAHFRQVGYKFDRWLDLLFLQKMLTE